MRVRGRDLGVSVMGVAIALLIAGVQVQTARGPAAGPSAAAPPPPLTTAAARATLDKYCVGCHNERRKAQFRNLALDTLDPGNVAPHTAEWELVVRKLRAGTMPPAGMPRPDTETYRSLVATVESALDASAAAHPDPGRPLIHRLNRAEYANAIRDLLDLDINVSAFLPADNSSYGFDNIADVLTMSPGLLDRYVTAARKIGRAAIGDPGISADEAVYTLSALATQEDRSSEALPFGTRGGGVVRHHFPLDGDYVIKVDLQTDLSSKVRGRHEGNQIDVRIDGERVKQFTLARIGPRRPDADPPPPDDPLEVRVPVSAGTHEIGVALLKQRTVVVEGIGPTRTPVGSTTYGTGNATTIESGRIEMGIGAVRIEGPLGGKTPQASASRRRIFVCRPTTPQGEEPCAKTLLATLARRAYRRPVAPQDLETLLDFFRAGRAEGSFDAGIEYALERILVAPAFLFRIERAPEGAAAGAVYRVSDVDLASRLSFFLWSSIPDDELLDLAGRGRLHDPAVLERQVRRMLSDARAQALVRNFFGQWLQLRNVRTSAPDPREYPEFDDSLREAFQQETQLFLESQLREDRSVLDLLTANYTFMNERLARHYGVPNIYGSRFRRVAIPDGRRAGVLGQGSILMVTSYANRTSPVLRGKWLLENILGTPAPEPPPNVPPFPTNDGQAQPTSVRARMEQHRRNPVCAACHAQLDPMGFGFENFDAIGQWRDSDSGTHIDASGSFPNGVAFGGPVDLRRGLLEYRDEFMATVARKLMTYALGRGVEAYDMPAVRTITRDAAAAQYHWSSLILGVVRSLPFQMRRSES